MITITGEPKEIAALVAELQGQRDAYAIQEFNAERRRFADGMEAALKAHIITQEEYDDFLREHP